MDADDKCPSDTANLEVREHCFQLTRVAPVALGAILGVCTGGTLIFQIPFFIPAKRGGSQILLAFAVLTVLGMAGAIAGYLIWSRDANGARPTQPPGEDGD